MKIKSMLKEFLFEIIMFLLAVMLLMQLLNEEFIKFLIRIIPGAFKQEHILFLSLVFFMLTAVLILWLFMQARKKKLKSTKKLSPFAKTVERSHKVREMSMTQTVYSSQVEIAGEKTNLPKDIDRANPNIVEFYFEYEAKLNI